MEESHEFVTNKFENINESLHFERNLVYIDTLIALRLMHAQFPRIEKVSIKPFILLSQLYSCVKDKTQVDRELELLKRDHIVRVFKINTGQDDHIVMFTDDYISQIKRAVEFVEVSKADVPVFDWFTTYVIDSRLEPSIGQEELISLLSMGGVVTDAHITILVNAGLLCSSSSPLHFTSPPLIHTFINQTRQLIDQNTYWFSIPNIGPLLKGLSQGRQEVVKYLKSRRHKNMMLATVEKKRLKSSPLDTRFHLRDLIGSGFLSLLPTPTGLLLHLST